MLTKTLTMALVLALSPAVLADVSSDIDGAFDQLRSTLKAQKNATSAAAADAESHAMDALASGDLAAFQAWKTLADAHSDRADRLEAAYSRSVAAHDAASRVAADLARKLAVIKPKPKSKNQQLIKEIQQRHELVRSMLTQRMSFYVAWSGDVPSDFMIKQLVQGLDWLEYQLRRLEADVATL